MRDLLARMNSASTQSRYLSLFASATFQLFLGFLVKTLFFVWYIHENADFPHMGGFASWDADSWEYINTVESWLRGSGWDPDHRLPGYAVIYLMFRWLLERPIAGDALVVFQLITAVLAAWCIAREAAHASKRSALFWPLYLLLLFTAFHAVTENNLINESLTTSALMFHWTFYSRFRRSGSTPWLIISGFFIMLSIFLRPIYGPLLAVVPLIELFRVGRPFGRRVVWAFLFVLPFLISDGIWTVRNYREYGGFHPLTNHGPYNPVFSATPYYAVIWYVQAYGGHCYWWDPIADMRWFGYEPDAGGGTNRSIPGVPEPPEDAYTSICTKDSLAGLAIDLRKTRLPGKTKEQIDSTAKSMMAKARRFRVAYAREHPFHYQVVSRLRLLKHQCIHSGTNSLFRRPFAELATLEKVYKLLQSAIYWWVLVVGMLGGIVLAMRVRRDPIMAVLGIMAVYGVLACPWIMRMAEIRYLIPVFPLLIATSTWLALSTIERVRGRKDRASIAGPAQPVHRSSV